MKFCVRSTSRLQRGSTLLVAVVILLLASLMALMAMNVGLFEQRSSGNDLRAKVVHQVAEAGLAQGFEYLFRANPTLIDTASSWTVCGAADTTFPCGAVDPSVRGSMYRLADGAGEFDSSTVLPTVLPAALTQRMLKVPATLPQMGGFNVAYGVAPVLCRVPLPVSNSSISCSTDSDLTKLSDRRVVTFVSVAQISGDSGRTTLTQTVARSSLLAQQGNLPTIIASGTVVPPGNGDIVAMPDAAGPGLDVAVWSRMNVDPGSGSFATCSRQDFLESGTVALTNSSWIASRTCAGCSCGMAKKSGDPEGWDILDKEAVGDTGTNMNVKEEEFPCDLFEYSFNVKGWMDGADPLDDGIVPFPAGNDGFCESRMAKVAFEAPDGITYQLYPEEAFLYRYAKKIKPIAGNAKYVRAEQLFSGNLGATDSGLVWCQTDCVPQNGIVGSVTAPVALVADSGTNSPFHAKLYGLLFFRSNGDDPLDVATGGRASVQFNAQSAIYGSLVVQGPIGTGSGGGLIYGDVEILRALNRLPSMSRYDTLRGGWTDAYSY